MSQFGLNIKEDDDLNFDANCEAQDVYGKTVTCATLADDANIILTFDDESALVISDGANYCCEGRYITCDDDLNDLVGG
jgi:hypothetical protein